MPRTTRIGRFFVEGKKIDSLNLIKYSLLLLPLFFRSKKSNILKLVQKFWTLWYSLQPLERIDYDHNSAAPFSANQNWKKNHADSCIKFTCHSSRQFAYRGVLFSSPTQKIIHKLRLYMSIPEQIRKHFGFNSSNKKIIPRTCVCPSWI